MRAVSLSRLVSQRVTVSRYVAVSTDGRRLCRSRGRCNRRLSTDGHGQTRPRPFSGLRWGVGTMRRPAAGITPDGQVPLRPEDQRCGKPWHPPPGAGAGRPRTREVALPERLSRNVIYPAGPTVPSPRGTPNRRGIGLSLRYGFGCTDYQFLSGWRCCPA
jgi:hypothetical protein